MLAVSSLPTARQSLNGSNGHSAFLKAGQAARYIGASVQTVRNLMARGEITGYVSPGGTRWISTTSLKEYAYGTSDGYADDEQDEKGSGIAVYVRVSSEKQSAAGSLTRQIERLTSAVCEREQIASKSIEVFKDVASSFGNRVGLNDLVDAMLDGRIKKVYAEHQNRLSRVPCLTALIGHIAKRCGVEIVALDIENEEEDSAAVWTKELMDYVTVWANRQSAAKSTLVTKRTLSTECVSRILDLRRQGLNATAVYKTIRAEGWKNDKGGAVSYYKVAGIIDANGVETMANAVMSGVKVGPSNPICQWFAQRAIVKSEGEYSRKDKKDRIRKSALYDDYVQWSDSKGLKADDRGNVGRVLSQLVDKSRTLKTEGAQFLVGVALVS